MPKTSGTTDAQNIFSPRQPPAPAAPLNPQCPASTAAPPSCGNCPSTLGLRHRARSRSPNASTYRPADAAARACPARLHVIVLPHRRPRAPIARRHSPHRPDAASPPASQHPPHDPVHPLESLPLVPPMLPQRRQFLPATHHTGTVSAIRIHKSQSSTTGSDSSSIPTSSSAARRNTRRRARNPAPSQQVMHPQLPPPAKMCWSSARSQGQQHSPRQPPNQPARHPQTPEPGARASLPPKGRPDPGAQSAPTLELRIPVFRAAGVPAFACRT